MQAYVNIVNQKAKPVPWNVKGIGQPFLLLEFPSQVDKFCHTWKDHDHEITPLRMSGTKVKIKWWL